MTPPSGAIVATPMLKRACGCVQEFQHYEVDRYRAERQAKFVATRCPACAKKQSESQRIPSKGESLNLLPSGAQLTLAKAIDGIWSGELNCDGVKVVAKDLSPLSLIGALAQQWVVHQRSMDPAK